MLKYKVHIKQNNTGGTIFTKEVGTLGLKLQLLRKYQFNRLDYETVVRCVMNRSV